MLNQAFISLKNLKSNAKKVKRLLPKTCKFCAVVKSDAYGHGLERCANALYLIVDCFAVAFTEEGVRLRLSGIDKQILVLAPLVKYDTELAVRYGLTLSVQSLDQIKAVNKEAKRQKKTALVHIKYNTGMNRLGVDGLEDLKDILEYSKKAKHVIVDGVYSHYSNPQNYKSLKKQTDKFLLANALVKSYNVNAVSHISASGGFLRGEFFDMVRIGILLYGYAPFVTKKISVKPVMKVQTDVIGTRVLRRGQSALYGDKKARRKTSVALVRFGYADGLPRKNVKGIFSNRCMNLSAVTKKAKPYQRITVMDNADITAKQLKTISYEVLTSCTKSAEKIYRS